MDFAKEPKWTYTWVDLCKNDNTCNTKTLQAIFKRKKRPNLCKLKYKVDENHPGYGETQLRGESEGEVVSTKSDLER